MGLFQEAVKGFVNGFTAGAAENLRASHAGVAAVEQLCRALGWSVDERVGDNGVVLHFNDPLIGIRRVLVVPGENFTVFRTFSDAKFPGSQGQAEIFGYLLKRNHELTGGAWQVWVLSNGNAVFAVEYCAITDGLNAALFKYICQTQVGEAHAFDAKMKAVGLL